MKTVSIHQPQYLPWYFYFQKIIDSDIFIFLDNVDYQKNGLQNRNQIKTQNGAHWLTIPVNRKSGSKINQMKTDKKLNWVKKHLQTINENYNKSSLYLENKHEFENIYKVNAENLSNLNIELIKFFLKLMKINKNIMLASELDVRGSKSELICNLCKKVGAEIYISGDGGKNYLQHKFFIKENIKIKFMKKSKIKSYQQLINTNNFIENLSILDLIFCTNGKWRDYICND